MNIMSILFSIHRNGGSIWLTQFVAYVKAFKLVIILPMKYFLTYSDLLFKLNNALCYWPYHPTR